MDPEIAVVMPPDLPDTGTYRGLEAMADYMRGFLEPWERVTIEAEELIANGDRVFAAATQRATGAGSGTQTELRFFQVWTLRDGRIIRFEAFRDRGAALAAAGIETR
jgi:uncharacterized protein